MNDTNVISNATRRMIHPSPPMPETDCCWPECHNPAHGDMPICFVHAYLAHQQVDELLADEQPAKPKTSLLYYLMLSPTSVKIGTTTDLVRRVAALRSELQYVVAVEPGDYRTETQRHREFATDRITRREDFRLSDRLKAHIEHLRENTNSEELIEMHRVRR